MSGAKEDPEMPSPWHRIGRYFGLVGDAEGDRLMREAPPTPSAARLVLGYVIAAVVGGAMVGVLDGDVRSGVIFGVLMAAVLIGLALWRRRESS
jgi:MYXO-CTERM domain-containing protein